MPKASTSGSFFLPFDEADTNEQLAEFMDNIGTDFPPAWAAGAWVDGLLFEQAVDAIVDRDGPNGCQPPDLLDELRTVTTFDADGWWATTDFTTTDTIGACFVRPAGARRRVRPGPSRRSAARSTARSTPLP